MRIIPTWLHGVLDYLVAVVLIAAPVVLAITGTPAMVLRTFGIIAIVYSLFTAYELGVVKLMSFRHHLKIDFVWGMLLAASPWLLGFAGPEARVWSLHVAAGLLGMILPVLSVPMRRHLRAEVPHA